MQEVFRRIVSGDPSGVTSVVTLAEVLVHPLRRGDLVQHQQYYDLLLNTNHLDTLPITAELAEEAAELRARYNLQTADALQIAVALQEGCEAFLTNDTALSRVTELRVLVLDELTL
jgi:predicted nucleic acid-binding protein